MRYESTSKPCHLSLPCRRLKSEHPDCIHSFSSLLSSILSVSLNALYAQEKTPSHDMKRRNHESAVFSFCATAICTPGSCRESHQRTPPSLPQQLVLLKKVWGGSKRQGSVEVYANDQKIVGKPSHRRSWCPHWCHKRCKFCRRGLATAKMNPETANSICYFTSILM